MQTEPRSTCVSDRFEVDRSEHLPGRLELTELRISFFFVDPLHARRRSGDNV